MTQPTSGSEHVQLELGLYVLGALSADEDLVVEEHLAGCASCRAESLELSEVPAFLSLLAPEDVRSLADEFAPKRPPPTGVVPRPRAEAAISAPPSRTAPPRPATQVPSSRPAASPTPSGGGRWRRGNTGLRGAVHRSRFVISAVALALVIGVGMGVGIASSSPDAITLAGSETNTVTGVTMSVTVLGRDTTSHVEASVNGLHSGIQYRLYAVNANGETQVVADWFAQDGPYAYTGELAVPAADLAFFTITQVAGDVVVTVRVAKSG